MRLLFLPSTRADLAWLRRYYARVFPDGAKRAAGHYIRTREALRSHPALGRPVVELPGVRELPIPRTPFSFIYRVVDGVRHTVEMVFGPLSGPCELFAVPLR